MRTNLLRGLAASILLIAGALTPATAPAAQGPVSLWAAAPQRAAAASGGAMKLVLAGSDLNNIVQLGTSAELGLVISSPAGVSAPPSPCALDSPTQAHCPAGSVSEVRAAMLAGDDLLFATRVVRVPIDASGGKGNDTLMGGVKGDRLKGDAGDDQLNAHGGRDLLNGGPGADTCNGGSGHGDLGPGCETLKGIP
jgi:Ca2+-binding RTX toxin-like protein